MPAVNDRTYFINRIPKLRNTWAANGRFESSVCYRDHHFSQFYDIAVLKTLPYVDLD